jgi:hypothetical protein
MLAGDPNALQPTQFVLTLFAFTPARISLIISKFKHALLQEYRYRCFRCIFCIPCSLCPDSVRKSPSRGERPGPPDGPIPLERVRSNLELSLNSGALALASQSIQIQMFPFFAPRTPILPCTLSSVLATTQNAQPMPPRAGSLSSWRGLALQERHRGQCSHSVMSREWSQFHSRPSVSESPFGRSPQMVAVLNALSERADVP